MRRKLAFGAAAVLLASVAWCAEAAAQSDSTVAQPAADAPASGDEVIHLHMPVHQAVRHRATRPPASIDAIGAEPASAAGTHAAIPSGSQTPSLPTSNPARSNAAAPAPTIPLSLGEDSGEASSPQPAKAAPSTSHTVKTALVPPSEATSPHSVLPSVKTGDDRAGLTKHGDVLFDKGLSSPSPAQFKGLKLLAGDLSSALEAGASRIQIEAYGGAPGDKSSDARRLSLKRALAVRQLLIDNGVPANRIDVRAMGGIDDKGPADRVDVFVRAG
ncbi:MAG TPA: OmpA family protein [Rhizomicrobium sp.]|jgi:outer membrane protein OmpA-like peptidoglycan-associated protein